MGLLDKIFGSYSEKEVKKIQPVVDSILALRPTYEAMSDEVLKSQTAILKKRLGIDSNAISAAANAAEDTQIANLRVQQVNSAANNADHGGKKSSASTAELNTAYTASQKAYVAARKMYAAARTGEDSAEAIDEAAAEAEEAKAAVAAAVAAGDAPDTVKAGISAAQAALDKAIASIAAAKSAIAASRRDDGTVETLDDVLPEAFAVCSEAAWRVLGKRPYPVQVIGGIILHQGRIAEMRTGEGKTLVASLPSYLNALTGKGVHVITVNEYLAKVACDQIGRIHRFLGLTVAFVYNQMRDDARRTAYISDITYGTNSEFGFDYLRDNMVVRKNDKVQRGHYFTIVDEVDSVLIDDARTPLIISGQGEKSTDMYARANVLVSKFSFKKIAEADAKIAYDEDEGFKDFDYMVDEKSKSATLLPNGVKKAEKFFGIDNLMDPDNIETLHHVNQALKAHGVMRIDVDYVIKEGNVVIVDESTGRIMDGRRYNEGLHQAIEAKEGVEVQHESRTLASVTFQNFFRMYTKLSGMTGTGMTEEGEFKSIYHLDVVEVPTNRTVQRKDYNDRIYKNQKGKFAAILKQIEECHAKGQPILVGTTSVEKSEEISKLLKKKNIKHETLNAKNHAREAEIVAQAGQYGAVTIATNMAGRGTDILLGGNAEFLATIAMKKEGYTAELLAQAAGFAETSDEEVKAARVEFKRRVDLYEQKIHPKATKVREAGGLFVLGTERHESRRIDNQLRGRAGRQGDVGESCFMLGMDDDLMRIFGGERLQNMMDALKVEDDMPIENPILSKSIESAQKKVEANNFGIRKSVLDFDEVLARQREIIYEQRDKVLDGDDMSGYIKSLIGENIRETVETYCVEEIPDNWNLYGLKEAYLGLITNENDFKFKNASQLDRLTKDGITADLTKRALGIYDDKERMLAEAGLDMREVERNVLLKLVDSNWMSHIDAMSDLRQGIHLNSMAQRDPVNEYRRLGFDMFDEMIDAIRSEALRYILSVRVQIIPEPQPPQIPFSVNVKRGGDGPARASSAGTPKPNDPCPCGSGKKYKKCCG